MSNESFVQKVYVKNLVNTLSETDLQKFKDEVEELEKKNDYFALCSKAWGYYEGDNAYEQDFVKSEKYLLKVYNEFANPFAANSLGYIYYYGRLDNGNPDFEKAYKYFSIGAMYGIAESKYKIADMFRVGNVVSKDPNRGMRILEEVLEGEKEPLFDNFYNNNYADIALRIGGYCEKIGNDFGAYATYLQAKMAQEKRMEVRDFFGDKKVMDGINAGLEKTKHAIKPNDKFDYWDCLSHINESACRDTIFTLKLTTNKDNIIVGKITAMQGNKKQKLLLTLPNCSYCSLVDSISFITNISMEYELGAPKYAETVWFNTYRDGKLYMHGLEAMELSGPVMIKKPKK